MFCEKCGAKIPDDSSFCEVCGAKIEPDSKPAPGPESSSFGTVSEKADKQGSSPNIIGILAGVAAVALLVIALLVAKKSGLIGGNADKDDGSSEETVAETVTETETSSQTAAETTAQTAAETATPAEEQSSQDQVSSDKDALVEAETQQENAISGPAISGVDEDAVIEDFDWFFKDGFPTDGTKHEEIWGLGGMWKCMMNIYSASDDQETYRMVIADTDVQYMGYKLTLLFHTKGRYEYPKNSLDEIKQVGDSEAVTLTMNGDWDEERTSMDVYSVNSALNCSINKFVEKNGYEYAFGSVFNDTTRIGDVVMIRVKPESGD